MYTISYQALNTCNKFFVWDLICFSEKEKSKLVDDTLSNGKMMIENDFAFNKFLDYETPEKKISNTMDSAATTFSTHYKRSL